MPVGHRPPIPPTFAKVTVKGTIMGHQWRTIFYLTLAGSGITGTDLNTLAGTINSAWSTALLTQSGSDCLVYEVQIVYIPSVGQEIVGTNTTTITGTRAAATISDAAAALVLNWNINAYYRGGHPRWYLPIVGTTEITNGSDLTSAKRSGIATAMNTFRSTLNSATTTNITSVTMGTLSFQTGGAWRTPPIFRAFGNASVAAKLGSQRRRIKA